jgi:hypothetical protein
MSSIAIIIVTLGLTFLAFFKREGMLYAIGIPAWIITAFTFASMTWPVANPYLWQASYLFCYLMAVVMTVSTIMFYITWNKDRRVHEPSDEELQTTYRKQVYKTTHKKTNPWD